MMSESYLFLALLLLLGALVVIGLFSCAFRSRVDERQHRRSKPDAMIRPRH